jgi:hypothetical protein
MMAGVGMPATGPFGSNRRPLRAITFSAAKTLTTQEKGI